ncbi:MAG TPA: acyl-CoA mutase large subunit family protein [Methylomirabilota bacterium]|nr:acyl-CoA mutase large subunit family protein [Methylomirabilota bacterium]
MSADDRDAVAREFGRWLRERHAGSRERQSVFETVSGLPLPPLAAPAAAPGDYLRDLGFPGEPPYTRGAHPTMYRSRLSTVRPLAGFGTPEDTNRRLRYLLAQGATGLSLTFDYPTLRGYNSDDPEARADAGKGGVAVDCLEDVQVLFAGVPVDAVSVSLVTCNPGMAIILLAMYAAMARGRDIPTERLGGTSQNDFLMETAITTAPRALSPVGAFRLECDTIEHALRHLPRWNPVSFVGYNLREAGATAVEELAVCFAHAGAVLRELAQRGLAAEVAAPRLSFFFSAHRTFFEEVAKYRAARRLWSRMLAEEFRTTDARARMLRFHVQTSGVTLTAQQPVNNVVRGAYQALAALAGGAQSLHVSAHDEAYGLPTEASARLALRTQQIIQHESGMTETVDPFGGSHLLERLTDELEARTRELVAEIEGQGGIVRATESGWVHARLTASAEAYRAGVKDDRLEVVGLNCFTEGDDAVAEVFTQPSAAAHQAERIRRVKGTRDAARCAGALDALAAALARGVNTFPAVAAAVEAGATLREVHDRFRGYYGAWTLPLA